MTKEAIKKTAKPKKIKATEGEGEEKPKTPAARKPRAKAPKKAESEPSEDGSQPDRGAKGKSLVIVESPAKAKTIEKYLGSDYKVMASVGHIIDLPVSTLG